MQRKRDLQEQKKKEWEQRKAQKEWGREQFQDFFWGQNFYSFLSSQEKNTKPIGCFQSLGISDNASESDIKLAYRKLAILHHPDKGGKQEKFIEITDSKNKCLSWLN